MGLFETYPLLLVPVIIITMEAWTALKALLRASWKRYKGEKGSAWC